MFGPYSFREADTWCYKVVASRFDIGLQEVVEAVDTYITPGYEEDVFVQIVQDLGMLVSNVAPHHHALAIGA
jgi:hypothetical protein